MDEDRQNLVQRREIISAYITVLERPAELLHVCAQVSGGIAEARAAVIDAFNVSEIAADAILSLQVRRFTPESITQMRAELADLERQLASETLI